MGGGGRSFSHVIRYHGAVRQAQQQECASADPAGNGVDDAQAQGCGDCSVHGVSTRKERITADLGAPFVISCHHSPLCFGDTLAIRPRFGAVKTSCLPWILLSRGGDPAPGCACRWQGKQRNRQRCIQESRMNSNVSSLFRMHHSRILYFSSPCVLPILISLESFPNL